MNAPRVIHTAQALVDEVVEIPGLPGRGQNAMASSYARYAASACNILLAAARSGAEGVLAGTVGTGMNADLIREALAGEGVAISSPPVTDEDTGICFVMIEPSAERTFVTTQGAERRISVESLATSAPVTGDFVCVSGYSLVGATRDPLLTWLAGLPTGVEVIFDPGAVFASLPAPIRESMLALTTVWSSNAEEAFQLTGWTGLEEAADAVAIRLPADAVTIVRDGAKGCVVRTPDRKEVLPGHPRPPIDTNGAGDAHTGILVAGRAAGLDWMDAARRANAGAAIKVTRRGPNTAPTAPEIDAFLAAEKGR